MTKEQAIEILKSECYVFNPLNFDRTTLINTALDTVIEALEQESIIDKIRVEILEEKECAYADFEQYKVDYLGQDGEDVQDSLPQDDFRYGMERCIEIIDKYKSESEDKE